MKEFLNRRIKLTLLYQIQITGKLTGIRQKGISFIEDGKEPTIITWERIKDIQLISEQKMRRTIFPSRKNSKEAVLVGSVRNSNFIKIK